MAKFELSLDKLGDLDRGVVRLMVDQELSKAINDLEDRGEKDGLMRSVQISIDMAVRDRLPVVQVTCKTVLPKIKSGITATKLVNNRGKHGLIFQSQNPEDPEQGTFEEFDQ